MSSSTSHIYAYDETSTKFVRINAKGNDLTTHDAEALAKLTQIETNTSTASPSEAISAQTDIDDVNTKIKLLSNASGHLAVDVKNASVAVTGTFFQATQPVSGSFYQATQPVSGDFYQATQPVSGSITVSNREIQRSNELISNDKDGTALAGSIGDGVSTAYVDIQNFDKLSMIVSGTSGALGSLRIQASDTTVDADFVDIDEVYEIAVGSDNLYRYTTESAFFRYYRIKNTSGSSITFSKILVNNVK